MTEVKFYKPSINQGFIRIFPKMWESLVSAKELTWRLMIRDIKAKYQQSLLGWLWVFIMPLITMATFLLLNISGIIIIGSIPVPYPIFGLLGIIFWQIMAGGLAVMTNSLISTGNLIGKINFPKEALVFSAIGQIIIDLFVQFLLVLLFYLLYGIQPTFWLLIFPLLILPILLLTLGIGFMTSLLNVVVRDTANFVSIIMNFLLFLMPVMYTVPESGLLTTVNKYNPIFYLINVPRDIIISGNFHNLLAFILSSLFALIIFILGWYVFYVSQVKLAERI